MIRWIPYTFVRTVLFFIGGILLGMYSPDFISESFSFFLLAFLTALYFSLVMLRRRFWQPLNPGWAGLALVTLLGYVHVLLQTEARDPDHLINKKEAISRYEAVMTRYAEEKPRSWKMEARVRRIQTSAWEPAEGKIILYFSKEAYPVPFQYGDVLLINGHPDIPEAPSNPGQFDYRAFLALKNIHHQQFLRAGQVLKVSHAPPNKLLSFAYRGREWAEVTLKRYVQGAQEQAIASALVLGVTEGLDNELLTAYAATGSMHILAVSGLHVSVLYLILLWMLKPMNRLPGGRWLVALVALGTLWLYAMVTGLSPSVLRAVTMFSFLAVARPWARSTNVYNTLAVSAFFLLFFDPFLIRSVGFQLSYLAVLGIVYLYPRILVLWEPRYWITCHVWKIAAVSIAAQLATFPLGLLYFHQFPNYFLLSNLLVVPLSSVVLVSGLLVLAFSFSAMIAGIVGYCLETIIRLLNGIVFTLEGFPFSLLENVYISPLQCGLIVLFIMVALALIHYRNYQFMVAGFLIALIYSALQWMHFFGEVNVARLAVYKIPGHSAIDLIDGGRAFFVADSALVSDVQTLQYHVTPHRLITRVGKVDGEVPLVRSLKGCRLLAWQGKTILMVTDRSFMAPDRLAVDWIIISNNAVEDVARFGESIVCEKVILDSSNSFFFASGFLEAAKLHKLEVHSVLHEGAYISEIEKQDT